MSISSGFYKATTATGHGIKAAAKAVTGFSALEKRKLEFSGDVPEAATYSGIMLAAGGGAAALGLLIPVVGIPLALAFGAAAAVTGAATGAAVPLQLNAAYLIGKNKREQKKVPKA